MSNMKIYVVGGAVRDELLGLTPKDFDYVVVGSSVEEMLSLGYKQVGADFPVFLHPETNDEYALARTERKTGTGYGGFTVQTEGVTLEEDLSRRDLTINAMAYEVGTKLKYIIDPFNGQQDLKLGLLRHVSAAFSEDPLRVVRLARFYARYENFKVTQSTKQLCARLVMEGKLNELSVERFWTELKKVFVEHRPDRFFEFMRYVGADTDVKFFNGLYGNMPLKRLNEVARCARVAAEHDREMDEFAGRALMLHTALMAKPNSPVMESADSQTKTLYKHVALMGSALPTDELVFQLLKQAKGFSSDLVAFTNVMMALTVAEACEAPLMHVSVAVLGHIQEVCAEVTAANFPGLTGKAIGDAMDEARKAIITKYVNL